MKNLLIDICIILAGAVFYGIEYLLVGHHTTVGIVYDIVFAGAFIYRLFIQRKFSDLVFLILYFPAYGIFSYINITVFNNVFSTPLIFLLLVVGAALFYLNHYTTPGEKRTVIDRVPAKQQITEEGEFVIQVNRTIKIAERSRYTHLQVIGATGSGKTRFVFFPHIFQDIMNGAGVMIFDIKSNMRDKIEKYVGKAHRESDYYYFNLGDLKSDSYNPLAGDDPGAIFNRIFNVLYEDKSNSEPFYIGTAERFLKSAIGVLKKKHETLTFEDLYWAAVNPKTYLQPICNEFPNDIYSKDLLDFMKKPENTEKNLLGLINKLVQFVTPTWAAQINTTKPKIDVGKIISEGKILLFQANSGKFQQEYKTISVLMMMHIQAEIANRYSVDQDKLKPFFMYLDEFDKIVYPQFPELINKAREAKVGLIFGHQSLGDLKKYGEDFQNQILTNSRNKIIFKSDEPKTVEYFSSSFGTKTVERPVKSFGRDGSVSGHTNKLEEEFIIHPNDIKFMRLGEGIVKIEDGYSGPTFIAKIDFIDLPFKFADIPLYRMKDNMEAGKNTNLDLNTTKADDKTGRSGGLKWKHIKADSEGEKNKDSENKDEEIDGDDDGTSAGNKVKRK